MEETEKINESEKQKQVYQLIIFWIMTILVFLSICLICYKLLFDFTNTFTIPDSPIFKKEIITVLFILFCGLQITKYLFIYSEGGELFGQYISGIIMFFMALGFYKNMLYLIAVSSLLIAGFFVYDGFDKKSLIIRTVNFFLVLLGCAFACIMYTIMLVN